MASDNENTTTQVAPPPQEKSATPDRSASAGTPLRPPHAERAAASDKVHGDKLDSSPQEKPSEQAGNIHSAEVKTAELTGADQGGVPPVAAPTGLGSPSHVQRRKTATMALSASPDHLRQMATAFLGNLRQLSARDAQSCFGFISFGEASAYMLELSKTSTFAEPLQRQLTAIFEAVADGRKQPNYYAATRRTDYDVLTAELTARGWTQDDLMTFSDARRLSSSPPEKVCRMVQDWFTVQLSLKDPELQSRLLAESLKPLVQG